MATKREYLAGLTPPLAKPGRGRFSAAAKDALAEAEARGVVFDDAAPTVKTPKVEKVESASADSEQHGRALPLVEPSRPLAGPVYGDKFNVRPKVRDVKSMTGQDSEGRDIAFANCARCLSHVAYCRCKNIKAPSYVANFVDTSIRL